MKKILVPTDFTPTAEKAFRFAVDYACRCNAKVILYHVFTTVESTFIDTEEKRTQYNMQIKTNALRRLRYLRKKVLGTSNAIPVETVVARSPFINNILDFAKQNEIDLIVMGTQGASGLKKVIIGSSASRMVEESPIPVLLIPEKYEWKKPEKIVFTSDYAASEYNALKLSIRIAELYKAGITVVHLLNSDSTEILKTKEIAIFETFAEHLQKSFSDFPLKFKPVHTNSVSRTMENLHHEVSYDMLVMVRRNKSFLQQIFLKSFTKEMCFVTTFPLLIIPADYLPHQARIATSPAEHRELHYSA